MASAIDLEGVALHGHMKGVTMLKFNRDGDLLFSSSRDTDCSACCWHTKTGHLFGSYTTVGQIENRNYDAAMVALDVNQESTLLATMGAGEEALLWSVETGKLLGTVRRNMTSGASVGFSHDDGKLMVATKGRSQTLSAVSIYNLPFTVPKSGEDIAPMGNQIVDISCYETDETITWASWGPTDNSIYYSEGGFMHILDVETNQVKRSRQIHMDEGEVINRFSFDPNYLTLATASTDKTSHLIDYRDLSTIQVYQSDVPVNDVSISPTADHVMLGGGMDAASVTTQGGQSIFEVKFYHKVHGQQLGQLRCHFGTITAMSFHPDGRGFASASYDGLIKMYRFANSYSSAPGAKPVWTL